MPNPTNEFSDPNILIPEETISPRRPIGDYVRNLKKKKLLFIIIPLLIILLIGAGFGVFYFLNKASRRPSYQSVYRLVNEKISQSAAIVIYLPKIIDKESAQKSVKFDPEIKGQWVESADDKKIVFQPSKNLKLNRHYSVILTMNEGANLKADFLAVENPEISAIFPKKDTEAPENSEITIIFNRPMVPLTTLAYLEKKDEGNLPIEITPETNGRFKWISTNTLQFIPEERLIRSSNYTIKVKPGFVSTDNLEVKETSNNFITRKLRYNYASDGEIIYDKPVSIYFNQPVDLNKTKNEITLIDNKTGKSIPFIAEYKNKNNERDLNIGKESNSRISFLSSFLADAVSFLGLDLNNKDSNGNTDESVINIYNSKDKFGRKKFWDFEAGYTLRIAKTYPKEGDIILDEAKTVNVRSSGPIANITAESSRSKYSSPDFFDPEGKLWIDFYEEIDLNKTKISSSKIKEIGYGQKCKDGQEYVSSGVQCEKVENKKRVYIIFKNNELRTGEKFNINIEKLVNVDNLTINKDSIEKEISVYPEFKILSTTPSQNAGGVDLRQFVFCTTTPVLKPLKEDLPNYFKSNLDYEIEYWSDSIMISGKGYYIKYCSPGEFLTDIKYGLVPESDYSLEFKLQDVFGQKKDFSVNFKTGSMPNNYLSFFHLQRDYNVTSPNKTKLTFATENMEYVNLEICKLSGVNFLKGLKNSSRYDRFRNDISGCEQTVNKRIDLPQRYWLKDYFNVDIKDYFSDPIGNYAFIFSNPDYKTQKWVEGGSIMAPVYEKTFLTVTNLSVAEKKISPRYQYFWEDENPLSDEEKSELKNLYWVTGISDLNPISGAQVNLYKESNGQISFAGNYQTNSEGVVSTDIYDRLGGVVVAYGKDSTVIYDQASNFDWVEEATSAKKIYIYTDKPIYRPTQDVFIKGIYRIGYNGDYEIYPEKKTNLNVYNSKGDEILSQELDVSGFGTFNTKLILEKDAPLGNYRICVEKYSCSYFDVEEYVPSAFEVNINADKEEYISKDTVNFEVNANYYFGVPLEFGDVEYTISSQNYYFDRYSAGNFGGNINYWDTYHYGDKFISRGRTKLDSDGKAKISEQLDFEKIFLNQEDRGSKIIVFDVTVNNSQGQSVSSQKSFIMHQGEFYLSVDSDRYFVAKNDAFNLRVKSVDTKGKDIKVSGASLNIYRVNWVYNKRQEADGGYQYKWEKQREKIQDYNFSTNNDGNYSKEIKISGEGEYEIEANAKDKKGNLVVGTYNIYVFGETGIKIRPTTDTTLDLEAKKIDLNIGEEGEIIIKSPYNKAKALISIERGKVYEYYVKDITSNLSDFSFKVKEDYIPNIYVSVLLVSPSPEVKFGKVQFNIDPGQRKLNIEVKPSKSSYLPGEEVVLDVSAKDYSGRGVSAEVSLSVVDLSVLALKGNPEKNPLIFFYGGFPLTVSTASNIKNVLQEVELFSYGTKGGGGSEESGLALKKRGIFKETAFWEAEVKTGNDGKALVKFILPDNLTTWRTESLGVTKDTKVGVNYIDFTAKKELMVIPLKPRFVIPSDVFYIGAQIFNQTDKTQYLTIKYESPNLPLKDEKPEKKLTIKALKSDTVYFRVFSPAGYTDDKHAFIISAKGDNVQDTVEQVIAVNQNNTYETVATSNYSTESVNEYVFLPDNISKDKGGLNIKTSSTLAVFLSDALNYLLQFPYGCSEQISSRLKVMAIVKNSLDVPNISEKMKIKRIEYEGKEYSLDDAISIGLNELYNNQNMDGGFTYWRNGRSDYYLTLYVIESLNALSEAKVSISQESLNKANEYIKNEFLKKPELYNNNEVTILTGYTLLNNPWFDNNFLKQRIINIANDNAYIQDKIGNTALSYLAMILTKGFDRTLMNKVFKDLDNRIDIDSRGAFLEASQNSLWQFYETTIKDTALYLKANTIIKANNPILEKTVRWLLNSKSKDGSWGSTNNTAAAIDAFTDYLLWKEETKSNFSFELQINGKKEGDFNFSSANIFEQFRKDFVLSDLNFNENNLVCFSKKNNNDLLNAMYYEMSLKYYLPADRIPSRDEGFSISREFYKLDDKENKSPVYKGKAGEVLRAHIKFTAPKTRNFVMIEDFIPAGMEIANLDLATEQKSLLIEEEYKRDPKYYRDHFDRSFYPDFKEIYDNKVFLYKENLSPGVYEFDYYVRSLIKGKFIQLPAEVSEMYFPENFGRSDGRYFEIE